MTDMYCCGNAHITTIPPMTDVATRAGLEWKEPDFMKEACGEAMLQAQRRVRESKEKDRFNAYCYGKSKWIIPTKESQEGTHFRELAFTTLTK